MKPVKAVVRGGRLVVDEGTELPDGVTVTLVALEDVLEAGGDYLEDEERRRLHAAVARGAADGRAGRVVDAGEFVRGLRARAGGG